MSPRFRETEAYLYSLLPSYQRVGAPAYNKGLEKTLKLLQHLGNPHQRFASWHVGGTNGKGSVSSILASLAMGSGSYPRVGLYTSPHLLRFTERIRINGQEVPEDWVCDLVNDQRSLLEALKPSFFEFTVAMAFAWFAQQKVDLAVVEVGLGGRLDSTNVLTPQLAVVTNIGWDHTDLLGNSLEAIAAEKAGIFKPEVPAVVGQRQPETQAVFEAAARRVGCPLLWAEDFFSVRKTGMKGPMARFDVMALTDLPPQLQLPGSLDCDLPGDYQTHNIQTAFAAMQCISLHINEADVVQSMMSIRPRTGLRGRFEVLSESPLVIADVAHNPPGMEALFAQTASLKARRLWVVFGMVREKDLEAILKLLPRDAHYVWTQPSLPRARPASELAQAAASEGLSGTVMENAGEALAWACRQALPNDVVLLTGSVFVVADALRHLEGASSA